VAEGDRRVEVHHPHAGTALEVLDHAQEVALKKQMGVAAFMPWIKKSLLTVFVVFGVLMVVQSLGFDVKALRQIVRLRKKSKDERQEEESILEVYMHALGMLVDTPLGDFAMRVADRNMQADASLEDA
jgi:hypothetical protein